MPPSPAVLHSLARLSPSPPPLPHPLTRKLVMPVCSVQSWEERVEALVDNSEWLSALALSLDNYDACATAFRESVEAAEKKAKAAAAKGGERTFIRCCLVLGFLRRQVVSSPRRCCVGCGVSFHFIGWVSPPSV